MKEIYKVFVKKVVKRNEALYIQMPTDMDIEKGEEYLVVMKPIEAIVDEHTPKVGA